LVGFDRLGRADFAALATTLAAIEKGALWQGAGRSQARALLWQLLLSVGGGVDDAFKELAEEAAPALVWFVHTKNKNGVRGSVNTEGVYVA
jgi:hypothetical protein